MRYVHKTVILDNVVQSVRQSLREGEPDTQKAGTMLRDFMRDISEQGWEIVAVNRIDEDSFMYTLKKPITE